MLRRFATLKRAFASVLLCFVLSAGAFSLASAQDSSGSASGVSGDPVPTYRNPVIPGDFPDPTIVRAEGAYYAAGTSSEWAPYYPLYTSQDLVSWEQIGHIFEERPSWTSASFWAPELFYRDGTFYVYYSARRRSDSVSVIGVATADDPREGFTDRGVAVEWNREAIDGFALEDAGGTLYMSWKAYGLDPERPVTLMASEMTPDGLGLQGEPFELLRAEEGTWEQGSLEGQALLQRGAHYYLFYSARGCCTRACGYQVGVARAEDMRGPWTRYAQNPILKGGGPWQCPGHGSIASDSAGRDYYLYHAYHDQDFVYLGRQGLLDEIQWTGDGWPFFKYGRAPTAQAPTPFGTRARRGVTDFYDAFDDAQRAVQWQWDFRHPPEMETRGGALRLGVTEEAAASPAGTVLAVRSKQGDYTATTAVQLQAEGQALQRSLKGLAAYGDASNALGLGVEAGRLVLWKVEEGAWQALATQPLADSLQGDSLRGPADEAAGSEVVKEVYLRMVVRDGYRYRFFWSMDGGATWTPMRHEPNGRAEIEGTWLPPWDRAVRAGLLVRGAPGASGRFSFFRLRYEAPQ